MKLFIVPRFKLLLYAVGLCIGVGIADTAAAKDSIEGPQLPELRLLPNEDFESVPELESAEGKIFAADIFRSAGQSGAGKSELVYSSRSQSCAFARPRVDLELASGCGTILADCPCDDMGTSHGGGGCAACFR